LDAHPQDAGLGSGFIAAPLARVRSAPSISWFRPALLGQALQIGLFAALVFALAWMVWAGADKMGYNWQWYRVPRYIARFTDDGVVWGTLAKGLLQTIVISAHAALLASVIGVVIAVARLSGSFSGRWLARIYLEIIRNTPLLVQIYIFYYVLARVFPMDRFWAGVAALACFEGAFISEILRAGIISIPAGQWEACRTLGMSRMQTYRHVVLPQAIVAMTPPLVSAGISLIKDSSIVSVIGLFELTTAGRDAISDSFMSFEIWLTVAAIYLVVTLALSSTLNLFEQKLRRRL
jgi:polar amino acid transport system permease protein